MVQFSQKTTKKMYLEDSSQKLERSKKKNRFLIYLKVSKFQNEFMKSSFLPKYEPNIVRISALGTVQGRNPNNVWFIFGEKR